MQMFILGVCSDGIDAEPPCWSS